MQPIMLDVSAVAGAFFKDEDPTFSALALRHAAAHGGYVPSLFWHDVRTVLLMGEQRGHLTLMQSAEALNMLRLMHLQTPLEPDDAAVLSLARSYTLNGYDSAYAALAAKQRVPLATLDKKLIAAGKAGAFTLWQPPECDADG